MDQILAKVKHLRSWPRSTVLLLSYVLWRLIRPRLQNKKILEGRAVVVTGCDYGIGAAVALRLAKLGAVVFAGVRDQQGAEGLAKALKGMGIEKASLKPIVLDVTKDADVTAAVATVRESGFRIAGLVSNAAISAYGFFEVVPLARIQACMDVNYFGILRPCREFLPMIRSERGRIVTIGSVGGRVPSAFGTAYLPSKAAAMSFTECLRQELHRFGVRVSIVEPGFFDTGFLGRASLAGAEAAKAAPKADEARSEAVAAYPDFEAKMAKTAQMVCAAEKLNGGPRGVDRIVDCVVDALTNRFPRARYVVGWDAHLLLNVVSWLPSWIIDSVQTLTG